MSKPSNPWASLVGGIVSETGPAGDGAPLGFATKVVAQWRAARREEALQRWSFWSLRAALTSMAACGLVFILTSRENDSPILVQPPSVEFVAVPLSNP